LSRKLDALFAEKVMGLKVETSEAGNWPCFAHDDEGGKYWSSVTEYSKSIDAAWKGVEKISDYEVNILNCNDGLIEVQIDKYNDGELCSFRETSTTPALALTKALLLAAGVSEAEIDDADE